jgi:micrococcal nuclease
MRRVAFILTVLVFTSLACSYSVATPEANNMQAVNEALQRLIVAATQTKLAEPPPPTATATLRPTFTPIPSDTLLPSLTPIIPPSSTATQLPSETPQVTATTAPVPTETPLPPRVGGCIPEGSPLQAGLVTRVIDGDTLEAFIDGQVYRVRYAGVDAPDASNRYGVEAKARNQELILGKNIVLIQDAARANQGSQLVRYVFVDSLEGPLANYEQISKGYARAVSPEIACAQTFQQAEQAARQGNLGLWSHGAWSVPTPTERPQRLDPLPLPGESCFTCRP